MLPETNNSDAHSIASRNGLWTSVIQLQWCSCQSSSGERTLQKKFTTSNFCWHCIHSFVFGSTLGGNGGVTVNRFGNSDNACSLGVRYLLIEEGVPEVVFFGEIPG